MKKFKIGDKVKIISHQYGNTPTNPPRRQFGCIGTIISIVSSKYYANDTCYHVKFKDHINYYRDEDLKRINRNLIQKRLGIA